MKRILATVLAVSMVLGETKLTAFATDNVATIIGEKVETVSSNDTDNVAVGWDGVTKNGKGYNYLLKIVSCGEVGYINYDAYCEAMDVFSNILSVY